MNMLLPPSRTEVNQKQIERFTRMYEKTCERLGPDTAEEHCLCNQIVIALWHSRGFETIAWIHEKETLKLERAGGDAVRLTRLKEELNFANLHARKQKNFAWRRRGEFFAMKTIREDLARRLKAA